MQREGSVEKVGKELAELLGTPSDRSILPLTESVTTPLLSTVHGYHYIPYYRVHSTEHFRCCKLPPLLIHPCPRNPCIRWMVLVQSLPDSGSSQVVRSGMNHRRTPVQLLLLAALPASLTCRQFPSTTDAAPPPQVIQCTSETSLLGNYLTLLGF